MYFGKTVSLLFTNRCVNCTATNTNRNPWFKDRVNEKKMHYTLTYDRTEM